METGEKTDSATECGCTFMKLSDEPFVVQCNLGEKVGVGDSTAEALTAAIFNKDFTKFGDSESVAVGVYCDQWIKVNVWRGQDIPPIRRLVIDGLSYIDFLEIMRYLNTREG